VKCRPRTSGPAAPGARMQYFVWGTDRPDSAAERKAHMREHWDFIASYDDRLIARGPVLDDADPLVARGSIHIVELGGPEEARRFAWDEPFAREGMFKEIVVRRFALQLGRTQFDFRLTPARERYMAICDAKPGETVPPDVAAAAEAHYLTRDSDTVCRGALLDDAGNWDGQLFFMEVDGRSDLDRFLAGDPLAQARLYREVSVHRWTLGGPENLRAVGLVK
jgi:uncharacterized protein YciI